MRIGIFTDAYEPYVCGVSTSTKLLRDTYISMGHDVYIVTTNLQGTRLKYDKINQILYIPSIKNHIYNETRIATFYSFKAMLIIKKWHLDVIHSNTEFGVGTFARVVKKQLKLPLVHTYHTLYEDYYKYVTKGHIDELAHKALVGWTKFYSDKTAEELIVPTPKIKTILENYGIDKEIHVIPTGIDTNKFVLTEDIKKEIKKRKEKYHINDKDFIIEVVGRLAQEKNHEFIIKSMPDLIKKNKNLKLMFIGDGPLKADLENLCKTLNIQNNVIFVGEVPFKEMPIYYHLASILASSSKSETQGLTVIEALASSKPVVCINDLSFQETVINNYNGFLFKDEKEFQKDILLLTKNSKLYESIKLNTLPSINKYSAYTFASDVLKVYAKAINDIKNPS